MIGAIDEVARSRVFLDSAEILVKLSTSLSDPMVWSTLCGVLFAITGHVPRVICVRIHYLIGLLHTTTYTHIVKIYQLHKVPP